ncbi:MAG: hypothetical protein LIP01_01955 [Tannerellaceae bacterium]|nr:hypothetical protein [Tannerellaceae bacterium]
MKDKQHRMKKGSGWVLFLCFLLFVCLFPGCMDDITRDTDGRGNGEEEITFSLRVPAGTQTRALTGEDEMHLNDIFVLVFEPVTNTFLCLASGTVRTGNGTNRSFSVTLRAGTFDLVVLANAGRWIAGSYPGGGIPRGELREEVEKTYWLHLLQVISGIRQAVVLLRFLFGER